MLVGFGGIVEAVAVAATTTAVRGFVAASRARLFDDRRSAAETAMLNLDKVNT